MCIGNANIGYGAQWNCDRAGNEHFNYFQKLLSEFFDLKVYTG
jgi:hypothetical protein